jgi:FixJ family two-component response regulator
VIDPKPTLLVIDDEPGILALVERFATGLRFNVVSHSGGRRALALVSEIRPDVVIVDLRMPEIDGLEMLRGIREIDPTCAVVLMTGHASVDSAIEAVRIGALDYLTKPLDLDRLRELLTTVQKGIERRETLLQIDADVAKRFEFHGMIGRSVAMQELFDSIRRFAPHVRTALISGETGTGKELVARALHKVGPRKDRRFLTVNCSAVVETLFESELFGHQKGAFTGATETKTGLFEHADGGTLFLDEVGELPLSLQPKLLRAVEYGEVQRVGSLQAKTVDTRVVAATNRDLGQLREERPDELRVAEKLGIYYYGFNLKRAPFRDNARLREALSMAIDREVLARKIIGRGEVPAYSWVPPGVDNYRAPTLPFADMNDEERRAAARRAYEDAGYGEDNPLEVEIRYNTSESHRRIAVAIQSMWRDTLGIEATLINEEFQVLLSNIQSAEVTEVFRLNWSADYNDAHSFLQVMVSGASSNLTGYKVAKFDELMKDAAGQTDPQARRLYLEEAEREMLADHPVIPLYFYVSKHLVSPLVGRWEDNVLDYHYSQHLELRSPGN